MVFSAIYVAFSRVKFSDDIRLLIHENVPWSVQLKYLEQLKPDLVVQAFYKGFLPNAQWDSLRAISYFRENFT